MDNYMQKLANELLEFICEYLDPHDLTKLSRCCHRFHKVAEPYLYSSFRQSDTLIDNDINFEFYHDLPEYVRTIVAKPYLARHMKHFSVFLQHNIGVTMLKEHEGACMYETWWPATLDMMEHTFARSSQTKSLAPIQTWDAVTAMLLILFSDQLQSLSLRPHQEGYVHGEEIGSSETTIICVEDYDYIMQVIQMLTKPQNQAIQQGSFSQLNRFSFGSNLWDSRITMELALLILELKSINHFQANIIGTFPSVPNDQLDISDESKGRFGTENLDIICSDFGHRDLEPFLVRFSGIKTLRLSFPEFPGHTHICTLNLIQALAHHRHSLEELTISEEVVCCISSINGSIELDTMESLAEFSHLKTVNTRIELFFPRGVSDESYACPFHEKLPPSLEYLTITDCDYTLWNCIREMILSGQSPVNLKTVDLYRKHRFVENDEGDGDYQERSFFENDKGDAEYQEIAVFEHGVVLRYFQLLQPEDGDDFIYDFHERLTLAN